MQPISIVYEEPHFLVVNKPAALFSQAPVGIDSLQARLASQLKHRDRHPGEPFIGLPHRLDRGTSGIMLIARNQRALKRFGEQFQSRKVIKHYLAVVEANVARRSAVGNPNSDTSAANVARRSAVGNPIINNPSDEFSTTSEQRWEDYLRKIPDQPRAEVVTHDTPGAKLAVANVQFLQATSGLCLLRVQLETGRMHQIRIQAASRGLPVVGDASYGASLPWKTIDEMTNAEPNAHPPVALHAWSLEFRHPQTAKALRFTAPVPTNWQQLPDETLACFPLQSIEIDEL